RRRDVVRAVRIEDAGKTLDLRAARSELVLTAAVQCYPPLLARFDRLQQAAHRPEARGLDVEPARLDWQTVEVAERGDRRVEAQAILGARERFAQSGLAPWVF